jgi:hypothetical protein
MIQTKLVLSLTLRIEYRPCADKVLSIESVSIKALDVEA